MPLRLTEAQTKIEVDTRNFDSIAVSRSHCGYDVRDTHTHTHTSGVGVYTATIPSLQRSRGRVRVAVSSGESWAGSIGLPAPITLNNVEIKGLFTRPAEHRPARPPHRQVATRTRSTHTQQQDFFLRHAGHDISNR